MKRYTAVLLAVIMLLGLAACGKAQVQPTATTTIPTTTAPTVTTAPATTVYATETTPATEETTVPPETTEAEISQIPMISAALPANTEYFILEDGTQIFSYQYQYLQTVMPDPGVADKIVLDFQTRQDNFRDNADDITASAEVDYKGQDNWTPYFFNVLYSPTRVDAAVLSLYGTRVSFSGHAHPERNCVSANYNMITGDVMTLGSILTGADAADDLAALLIEAIDQVREEKNIPVGYADTIENRFSADISYDEAWYFSTEGLCFYFSPYEIAPYSSGTITVTIPYEKLVGVLEDGFFPAERSTAIGTVTATRWSDTDRNSLTQITEVILDREGEMVFLYTDKQVYDVFVEFGSWNEDGTQFTAEYTAFATPTLTPGDAVMLQTSIPDVMPTLRLTYLTGDTTVVQYISQSGEDGSIILLDK